MDTRCDDPILNGGRRGCGGRGAPGSVPDDSSGTPGPTPISAHPGRGAPFTASTADPGDPSAEAASGAGAGAGGREAPRPGWEPAPLDALGDRIWLVLGGGGLKGLAHVGAWQALEEAGVRPAGIIGCSIGGLVGALVAAGMGWEELVPLAFRLEKKDIIRINRRAVWVNGIRQTALFQGEALREYISRVLPVREWGDLELPLQLNAVNLETGLTEWFGTGAETGVPLADAIYASTALPVFYPPAVMDGKVYVDGGAEYSLPLHRAAEVGATGIIAVDVGSGKQSRPHTLLAEGMLAIHQRVFSIMSWRKRTDMVTHWAEPPLLFVRPRLEGYRSFAFEEVQYFLEEGYRATRAALLAGV